jgi:hypothetical protein
VGEVRRWEERSKSTKAVPIVTLDGLSGMIDLPPPCVRHRMVSIAYDHVEQAPSPMFRGTNTWKSQHDVLLFTYVVVYVYSGSRWLGCGCIPRSGFERPFGRAHRRR